jgi:hypothetical protein
MKPVDQRCSLLVPYRGYFYYPAADAFYDHDGIIHAAMPLGDKMVDFS